MREITPECTLDYTVSKIERARQAKESYNIIIPIMAKFSDWSYTKSLKTAFIETAKNTKYQIPNQFLSHKCTQEPMDLIKRGNE